MALLVASLLYFRYYGDRKLIEEENLVNDGVTPARTESYFAKTYGIEGDVFELVVSAESPLVGMTLGEAENLHDAPLLLALKTGNDTRLAPPARCASGSAACSVRWARASRSATSRRTSSCACPRA